MERDTKKNFDVFLMKDIENTLDYIFASGGKFTIYPKGTSMLPILREGKDSVELSAVTEITKNGIYLYKRPNGNYALHRLLKIQGERLIFSGDNQLVMENVKKEQLLAYVSCIYHGKRDISNKLWYRIFLFLNSRSPIRRIFIKWRKLKNKFAKNNSSKTE